MKPDAAAPDSRGWLIRVERGVVAVLFMIAGAMHFLRPAMYERMVPPGLGPPALMVQLSGVAEMLGGATLLVPRLRRWAGWGLITLLIAVFPANIYMALHPERFANLGLPHWTFWARLPLQALLITWVWRLSRAPQIKADPCAADRCAPSGTHRSSAPPGGPR